MRGLCGLVVLIALSLLPRSAVYAMGPTPDVESLLSRVRTLTSPELAGRGSGTPELVAAADTLTAWLTNAGLRPAFGDSWYQAFGCIYSRQE